MEANSTKSRKFKTASPLRTAAKTKRGSFNANLSTNYELMLRIYLVEKKQQQSKEGVKYPKVAESKKMDQPKAYSFSVWNNITQVFTKANNIITNLSWPAIGILSK